ncbi:MAG: T9SS type A sorting domain-containing protein [Bacteroidetes bacterium]|nr:T9SS type A sorting domain-containing protein [Bacteroidota bacterium]
MFVRILTLLCFIPALVSAQAPDYTFYNKGAGVYIQPDALVHIQGTLTNDNGSTNGLIQNDGVIEIKKDIENKTNAIFRDDNGSGSSHKAVRFVGSGKQVIAGDFSTGNNSFFNLIVDQTSATDTVEMRTNVNVKGSLLFGSSTTSGTYTPNMFFPYQGTNGLLKTYDTNGEYLLNVQNNLFDAIWGYAALDMNAPVPPSTAFIMTKGNRGSNAGGVTRAIGNVTSYDFPIGTEQNGYNAVRLNLQSIPAGVNSVKAKFCDSTSSVRGYVGTIAPQCIGCGSQTADNTGFNYYSASNPCNAQPQWAIFEESGILEHGYWSFDATNNNLGAWKYDIEVFPNSYELEGTGEDSWRVLKYHDNSVAANQEFGVDPSDLNVDWGAQVMNVENPSDLFTYTKFGNNPQACYQGNGVPGGVYTDFSHFSMHTSNSSNALPVEMIYLKADAVDNKFIQVSWATAIEINNNGFEVLRSTDGINFTKIGWVDGNDNSTVVNTYTYDDYAVAPNVVYYYKLRQLDNDGASEETYIVHAAITSGDVFVISDLMPNPTKDVSKFTVTTSTKGSIDVKVYDNIGRIVIDNQSYQLEQGQNTIYVNGANFAAGTYNIIISTGNDVYSKKLIINQQ